MKAADACVRWAFCPMQGFAQAGITVFYDAETPGVGDVAKRAAAGELPVMGAEHACHH